MEFKPFPKINNYRKLNCRITQKIHGSNAQVFIAMFPDNVEEAESWMRDLSVAAFEVEDKYYAVRAGSRNRWIFPGDDNYGFAAWVDANKKTLVKALGVGTHFGEWAGPGINSGEGLTEKTFVLFDHWRYEETKHLFLPNMVTVPVLYEGPFNHEVVESVMDSLKEHGSKLAPGFMRPEGAVIELMGHKLKYVFEAEETQWKRPSKVKAPKVEGVGYSHLLQPVRLEKLLSKDEKLVVSYPDSLPQIVKEYVQDLIDEGQISGDEDQVKAIKKGASGQIFGFVKEMMRKYGN